MPIKEFRRNKLPNHFFVWSLLAFKPLYCREDICNKNSRDCENIYSIVARLSCTIFAFFCLQFISFTEFHWFSYDWVLSSLLATSLYSGSSLNSLCKSLSSISDSSRLASAFSSSGTGKLSVGKNIPCIYIWSTCSSSREINPRLNVWQLTNYYYCVWYY